MAHNHHAQIAPSSSSGRGYHEGFDQPRHRGMGESSSGPICWLDWGTTRTDDYIPYSALTSLKEFYNSYCNAVSGWANSPCRSAMMEHSVFPSIPFIGRIEKALIVGLGSLRQCDRRVGACRHHSQRQLVAFMDVVQTLQNHELTAPRERSSIRLMAQDPDFTPLDMSFLTSLGIDVVSQSDGTMKVDRSTFVFVVKWDTEYSILGHENSNCRPAFYIGLSAENLLNNCQELLSVPDTASQDLCRSCVGGALSREERDKAGGNMVVLESLTKTEVETHEECSGTESAPLCPIFNLTTYSRP